MDKKSYINIAYTEETGELEYECNGTFENITYLASEVLNELKKTMIENCFSEGESAAFVLAMTENALNTFE